MTVTVCSTPLTRRPRSPPTARAHLHPSNTRLNQLNVGVVGDLGTGKTQLRLSPAALSLALTKALIYRFTRPAARNRGHAPKIRLS